jgi:hypothetical protein
VHPDGLRLLATRTTSRGSWNFEDGDARLVIGSRYVAGGSTVNWNLWRRAISRFGSFYARTLLGTGVQDFTGGFKRFDRAVLEAIELDRVDCHGYAINVELTYRAISRGFVVEIPITFVDRQAGKSKMLEVNAHRGGMEGAQPPVPPASPYS